MATFVAGLISAAEVLRKTQKVEMRPGDYPGFVPKAGPGQLTNKQLVEARARMRGIERQLLQEKHILNQEYAKRKWAKLTPEERILWLQVPTTSWQAAHVQLDPSVVHVFDENYI